MMEDGGVDLSTEDRKPAASRPETMANPAASRPETMAPAAASSPPKQGAVDLQRKVGLQAETIKKQAKALERKDKALERKDEMIKRQAKALEHKDIVNELRRVFISIDADIQLLVIKMIVVDHTLSTLACLSQAELTANFVGEATNNDAIRFVNEHAPGAISTGNIAQEVMKGKKELSEAEFLPVLDDHLGKALLRVSTAYESLIMNACDDGRIFEKKGGKKKGGKRKGRRNNKEEEEVQDYKASYKAKMEESMKWFRSCVAENSAETDPDLWFPGLKGQEVDGALWFPGLEGQELDGAQVMLAELVRAVGDCFDERKNLEPHWKFSPPKTSVKREAIVAGTEERHKRIVDLTASKPGQFQLLMLDHNIRLPCEIKPVLRSGKNRDDESCEQILSHLAKACYDGLTFLNIGTSTIATGLTSNLACIQVHQLHLKMCTADSKTGTPPVDVELHQSARLPLMSEKCFDSWVKACKETKNNDIRKLRTELYGEATIGSVPSGLRALYGVMTKRRAGTFGPSYEKLFKDNEGVGEVLGHGSFGVIMEYSDGENHDYVLKVPRFPEGKAFQNEQKILKALEKCKCSYISKFVMQKQLTCSIGNMEAQVPGLVLTPRGIPLPCLLQREKLSSGTLNGFVNHMFEALEVIHRENIHHNDVSPKNIVVVKKGHSWEAVLVDFGNATSQGEKLVGFVGHVHYVHDEVLSKYPSEEWTPGDKHDFAALAFSMAAVFGGGEATWDMKGLPCSSKIGLEDVLDKRRGEAKRWLGQYKAKDLTSFIEPGKSKRQAPMSSYNLRPRKRKKT